ncbi:anti-sigma factor [Cellulomonas fimi]|uniref:anti-sigma factor n=1 Tax=Cellulomonas fimi TaxID=1708 RepID=UPI00234C3751|nr:anti-sigma factor [Cellulomonas fimi]MDC7123407.1 anti-sigma factor [Cellulomonas fimi]
MSEHDDVRALLGAYALDAVDDDERRAVEALVAADPDAARELADLRAVAARLGAAVEAEPPVGARDAVLAAIASTPQDAPGSTSRTTDDVPPAVVAPAVPATAPGAVGAPPVGGPSVGGPSVAGPSVAGPSVAAPAVVPSAAERSTPRRGPARWYALAAAVAIGAAVPGALLVQQVNHTRQVQAEQQQVADLLTDPSAVLVHQDVADGGDVTAILTDTRAVFTAENLPDPDDGRVYQLWVVREGKPLSAGVMTSDDGTVRQFADDFAPGDALAVTVEPAGGSAQPTSDPIVVLAAA